MAGKMTTSDLVTDFETPSKYIGYTVTISPYLHNRLEQLILIAKISNPGRQTKQKWVLDAIKEKLAREEKSKEIIPERKLNLKIDDSTFKKLKRRVELIKQFRTSYSKKQWIVDAILEKLEKDDHKIEQILHEINHPSE